MSVLEGFMMTRPKINLFLASLIFHWKQRKVLTGESFLGFTKY